jgi:acetyltransferase-like isoleucine patch superfamily enzyme
MNTKVLAGSVLAFAYNGFVGRLPSRTLRSLYLRGYLARLGRGTGVQMGCRFLNGRKVFLGDRNVVNFDCLLDGRRHAIRVGNDVSIGPEASILTLGHDPQSPDFADMLAGMCVDAPGNRPAHVAVKMHVAGRTPGCQAGQT